MMVGIEREDGRYRGRTAMSKRENAFEMMVGIEREDGRYRGRTHMRTAMSKREKRW